MVLDIDPRNGGERSLEELLAQHGDFPETVKSRTGSGGTHYFFRHPCHISVKNSASKIGKGIDIKADGGYVVGPPSNHKSGENYAWINRPEETVLAELPAWLLQKLTTATPKDHAPTNSANPDIIPNGERNTRLASIAGSIRKRGMTPEEILPSLAAINEARCDPPLTAFEVERIAGSVGAYPVPAENMDLNSLNSLFSQERKWPKLDSEALHGLVGDIVKTIGPHTEADPITLVAHTIAEFSAIIGRSAFTEIDGYQSPLLFWPVLIGSTSKARKGSGENRIKRLFQGADPLWMRGQYRGALSSGEGLVFAVRDPQLKINKKGEEELVDEGVEDKRLYLVQSEFGSMLKIMRREGNCLSGVVRDSWDGQDLRPMTKNNRLTATNPHIVIGGHVTEEELTRQLSETDMANGFANRFAWFMVKRSSVIPFATNPSSEEMVPLVHKLRDAVEFATNAEEVTLSQEARQDWLGVYAQLSEGKPGICGALLARAEAYVRRISALYALLDKTTVIGHQHIGAALALWQYTEDSAAWVFGDKLGDPIADTILDRVKISPDGLTDSQISDLFGRHESASRLSAAKGRLQAQGKIESRELVTPGRSTTKWHATAK